MWCLCRHMLVASWLWQPSPRPVACPHHTLTPPAPHFRSCWQRLCPSQSTILARTFTQPSSTMRHALDDWYHDLLWLCILKLTPENAHYPKKSTYSAMWPGLRAHNRLHRGPPWLHIAAALILAAVSRQYSSQYDSPSHCAKTLLATGSSYHSNHPLDTRKQSHFQ